MVLPANFPIISPVAPVQTGIIVGISPQDPTFDMEIQRAPDSSGAPGTPVTINRIPPFALGSGTHYTDRLPVTGALYYYRFRHVRDGWTAGAYGPWSRSGTAKFLDNVNLPPAAPVPFTPIPNNAATTVAPDSIGDSATGVFGTQGRADLVFNGDCEMGLAYWLAIDLNAYSSGIVVPEPTAALAKETASPFSGSSSIKFTSHATKSIALIQVNDATDAASGQAPAPLFFRVKAGESYRVRLASKASVNSKLLRAGIAVFDGNKGFVQLRAAVDVLNTTSYVENEGTCTIPSNVMYGCLMLSDLANDGTTVFTVDDLHVWRQQAAGDVQDASITNAKIANAAVDFTQLTAALGASINLADRRNVLRNPGFEDGQTYWQTVAGASVPTNSGNAKSGNKYLEITASVTTDVNQVDEDAANMYAELAPGSMVYYGGWAQLVSGTGTAVIKAVTADKDKANRQGHQITTTAAGLTLITGSFLITSTDKYLGFMCELLSPTGSATVRFDDVFAVVVSPGFLGPATSTMDTQTGLSRTANTEASVGTTVLPAGLLKANAERIRIHLHGTISAALTAGGTVKVNFGATTVLNYSIPTGVSDSFHAVIDITRTGATTQVSSSLNFDNQGGAAVLTRAAPAETLANAITIDYRLKSDGTRSVTLEGIAVEYLAK